MKKTMSWIVWSLAPAVSVVPMMLADCGGDSSSTADGGAQNDGSVGSGSSAGAGTGSASGASGSGGDAGGGGTGSRSGTGSTTGGSGSGAGGGGDASGGTDAGGRDAATLCTSPGNPPGCVQCLSDTNCATGAPRCLNGTCVTCMTNADCGNGTTPACWPSNHTCHAACGGDGGATCPTGAGQPSLCDPSTGACVGCRSASDCPTATPVCDSTTKRCVQCESDSNCSGSTPRCDTATSTCVACLTSSDCTSPSTPVCRAGAGGTRTCQAGCTSNAQCTDAGASRCNAAGNCVQCVDDSTCSGTTPVCDTQSFGFFPPADTCVACLPASAADAGAEGCEAGHACVQQGPGSYRCQ